MFSFSVVEPPDCRLEGGCELATLPSTCSNARLGLGILHLRQRSLSVAGKEVLNYNRKHKGSVETIVGAFEQCRQRSLFRAPN